MKENHDHISKTRAHLSAQVVSAENLLKGKEIAGDELESAVGTIEKAFNEGSLTLDVVMKAHKDTAKLVKKKRLVTRNGKTYLMTVYVDPEGNQVMSDVEHKVLDEAPAIKDAIHHGDSVTVTRKDGTIITGKIKSMAGLGTGKAAFAIEDSSGKEVVVNPHTAQSVELASKRIADARGGSLTNALPEEKNKFDISKPLSEKNNPLVGINVLGQTKSFKPIYSTFNHEGHKKFSGQDHLDAYRLKEDLSDRAKEVGLASESEVLHSNAQQHREEFVKESNELKQQVIPGTESAIDVTGKSEKIDSATKETAEKEKNIEVLKKKHKELKRDLDYVDKRLKEYQDKGWYINSKNTQPWQKETLRKVYNERERIDANMEKIQYGHDIAKKILKGFGIPKIQASSTAVRGWHNYSAGWELSNGSLRLTGGYVKRAQEIASEMIKQGFEIEKVGDVDKMLVGGSVININFKKYFE